VGYLYCIGNPRTDWLYATEPDAGPERPQLRYPRGKVLGGCSSINGMIYMRGQARDYDHWAALTGDEGWSWDECLPDFMAHEDYRGAGADAAPGHARPRHGGEWRVEKQRLRWDDAGCLPAGGAAGRHPATDDFNRGDNFGVGYFEVNQKRGWRWNATKAFLRPVSERPTSRCGPACAGRCGVLFERRDSRAALQRGIEVRAAGAAPSWSCGRRREVILAPGPSARRRSCSCRASAPAAPAAGSTACGAARTAGRRREPAGPPADPRRLPGAGHATLNTLANSCWGKAGIGWSTRCRAAGR
jgi:choline dehydrogenase